MKKGDTVFPDTNVVIRYLLRDNAEQFAAAESFFEEVRIGKKRAVILESVIVESLYVLTRFYGIPREEAAGPLAELLSYKGMVNGDTEALAGALNLFSDSKLDPVDCVLAARHRRGEGNIYTFDKELKNATTGKK